MQAATYKNREVWILDESDDDPTCGIWICFIDDPDQGAIVMPEELTNRECGRS